MIVAIHQPEHLPWLGFFNKMANADKLVILDNVQYRKRYFQNRNKILVNGAGVYIGIPVKLESYRDKTIADMEIYPNSEVPWKYKYLKTIEYNYKRHPFFDTYFPFFEELLDRPISSLYEFNMEIIRYFAKELGIATKVIKASDLFPAGAKSDLILDIAKKSGADVYLSGPAGRDYMDLDKYEREGIDVWFNDFRHPEYYQKGTGEFVSYLSTLDLLMNVGADEGRKIIQSGTSITKYKECMEMSERETVWKANSEDVVTDMLKLRDKYEIEAFKAIELYGGDGHTLSNKMAEQCISFVGYDINPAKEEGFKRNVANGEFRCGDSVKMMQTMQDGEIGVYNLISTDAPICIYGKGYCEHFEILQYIYKLLESGKKALCVFPVTVKPYDTEKEENRSWMEKRAEFYGTDRKELDKDMVYEIYDDIFKKQGLKVFERCYVCREYRNGVDWMYEYMYVLKR